MSPLTKALVLLVTVLSIVLVALVVPFVANTDDLEGKITALETQKSGAEASARAANAKLVSLEAMLSESDADRQRTIAQLQGERTTLASRVDELEGKLKGAVSNADKLGASLALLGESQKQLTELLDGRTTALGEAQSANVDLKREIAQLAQRNDELDNQVNSLTRTTRAQKEQITDLVGQVSDGGAAIERTGGGVGPAPAPEVRGAVTGAQQLDNEITLIQLNVGANDGVSPGTQFVVYTGNNDYVGRATVQTVDETVSVAKVDSAQRRVRAGDGVISGQRF